MDDRETWLAETLVTLADTLVADFDVIELLATLVERVVDLLNAAEVGLVLADPLGHLRVMACSTERMRLLELFEVQTREGPCLDCYRDGVAVVNVDLDLDEAEARWPLFAPMARSAGFRVVHAVPMRLRERVIGAANVFHSSASVVSERDLRLVQALADVATIGILQERAVRGATDLTEQLQVALTSRVVIEQAKGVVAERAGIDMDAAFGLMRGYARGHSERLVEVARAIVAHTLTLDALMTQADHGPPGGHRRS